ncbi:type IV secretion system DNA-binding domain-containing protein [Patescibacteria group bacterium]|nr:type IV secretion system DNA-binding domain-containing protein [Patescibacteria group bacterium]
MLVEIRIPRDNEYTPESAAVFFSGLTKTLSTPSALKSIFGKASGKQLTLEIACFDQQIRFYGHFPDELESYFQSQFLAAYPAAAFKPQKKDYLAEQFSAASSYTQLALASHYYYPIRTYKEFTDVDPIANLLSAMSKGGEEDFFLFQMVLTPEPKNWQGATQKAVETGIPVDAEGTRKPLPGEALIKQKMGEVGLTVALRLAANTQDNLNSLAGTFAAYAKGEGNSLKPKSPGVFQKNKVASAILDRRPKPAPRYQILTVSELATLWHLPGNQVKVPNIAWGQTILFEPPENLPASIDLTDEQKDEFCFVANTQFKNRDVNFGLKRGDRRRHLYIVGKTGTGKSTLIANMAIDDIKKGKGVAVIDPHGDLCETILDYIPRSRINDVCYFNPADRENPISLNILEVIAPIDAELVTSGIVSIFHKLYAESWGPRLEYIMRNAVITLANVEGTTLVDILRILTNKDYRDKILAKVDDQVLHTFWKDEFEKMPPKLQKEAISPIQNKVGQFVTSPLIRNIIGRSKSSLTLEDIMENNKILLVNLSQGRLGEDNSALLGAMIITKIQQAAMHRVNIPEEERKDFYLYVDEFQNFATRSFIKILSEARKYRLNLTLANQYTDQIDDAVLKAIFGNVGSVITFVVGATDGMVMEKEFGGIFTQKELVALDRFQVASKLTIDKQMTRPFLAHTLPLPKSINQNRSKVVKVSRERYAYKKVSPPKPKAEIATNEAPAPNQPEVPTK